MPASGNEISSTDAHSTTRVVSDNNLPDEDVESDYQSCISAEDEEHSTENYVDGGLEILRYNIPERKWEPILASDRVGAPVTNTGWISQIDFKQRFAALVDSSKERCRDAIAVLAETSDGPARAQWYRSLATGSRGNYFFDLQTAVIVLMNNKGAWTNDYQLEFHFLYIPSQGMYHWSFTSRLFEGRILFDWSLDRPSKDLAEVMRIALPFFRELNARIDSLSKHQSVDYSASSSDSPSIFGPANMANLVTCLDIAESVAKLVPVFGSVLEGACGILRKTVQAAQNAGSARDQCQALAEHTASITLAILSEIGSESSLSRVDINRICDLRETIKIVDSRIQRYSKLGRARYFVSRGRINEEVMDLRTKVDNARIAFNIRSDISTTRLLTDLKDMQTRLASRVDDIYDGQKTTHHMLRTILVKVQGSSTGDAYVEEEAESERRPDVKAPALV